MKKITVLAAAAALTLAACGSVHSTTRTPSAKSLAARIGCTSVTSIPPSVYAMADVPCDLPSRASGEGTASVSAEVITFGSAGAERQWFASRPSTNGGGGFIQGKLWIFDTNGMEPDIRYVISILGGRETATPDPGA